MEYKKLRARDWEALLRLGYEANDLPAGSAQRRRYVAGRARQLVGAVGLNLFELDLPGGGLPAKSEMENYDDMIGTEAVCNQYVRGDLFLSDPVPLEYFKTDLVCVQSADMVDMDLWRASAQFEVVRKPFNLDHQIYSRCTTAGRTFGIGVHRARGDRAFSAREMEIAAALSTLCVPAWGLAEAVLPGQTAPHDAEAVSPADPRLAGLPPRFVNVLHRMLAGDGSKQIAQKLGLSRHTVFEYTKQLYRRLGVSGRGELLAMFVRGA